MPKKARKSCFTRTKKPKIKCTRHLGKKTPIHITPAPITAPTIVADAQSNSIKETVIEDLVGPKTTLLDNVRAYRMTVAFLFLNVHDCEEDSNDSPWNGRDGIMAKIKRAMNVGKNHDISPILLHVLECKKLGMRYNGDNNLSQCGRNKIIDLDSVEAQIAVDAVESGSSLAIAWNLVNQHRKEEGLDSVTRSAIYNVIRQCRPKSKPISYRKQGSTDPTANNSKARLAWCQQLGVRFGCYDVIFRTCFKQGLK
jgi:hypothetical protein